ncbi:MAG: alanyl-tRNA editing protein [Gammaproteobacteria bacterium]|nr:alanyl-tRNA editing protein [Gammaproteobacteria bacterium]MDH3482237.1 alanyl-tRNA editing protein [Gammaproteobacteria bacterium]
MQEVRRVYYDDSYQKTLSTTIAAVDKEWIELDETIFYPLGGGQPGDTGFIRGPDGRMHRVLDTRKSDSADQVRHQLDSADHGLEPGDRVDTEIDWERRFKHMRMHTSMHLLGSLIPVPVTGGSVGAEKSRLDFDLGEHQINKEDLTTRINALIAEGHPVAFGTITEADLDKRPELVRTMSVQPPRGAGDIRTVRVEGVDFQPCGGTHVNNTREIGAVRISKIENKGKRNRRVHLVLE